MGGHVGAPHVIIGAGILGAATAYHLARAGRRVVVLEAAVPASGASANSFAWVNAVHKEPEPYHRLNAAGVAEYATVMKELGEDSRSPFPPARRSRCSSPTAGSTRRA
ncbi:MAG: FAD-binding oxidoreductase [Candidatus Rokubacteria bacterium]|nr:FAD-binding oxidoreductase [Candidatus Rokubacteria bacterium]